MYMKNDYISFFIFIIFLPIILLKIILFSIPTFFLVLFSYFSQDFIGLIFFRFMYLTNLIIVPIENLLITILSITLYGVIVPLFNRYQNGPIIDFFEKNLVLQKVEFQQLPYNIRTSIPKEGVFEIYYKILLLFSCVPIVRHIFITNPYLFRYKFYLTNQVTLPFENAQQMCNSIFEFTNTGKKFLENEKNNIMSMDNINFTANYYNNKNDRIDDKNNLGLQITKRTALFLHLETCYKSGQEMFDNFNKGNHVGINTVMHPNHPWKEKIRNITTEKLIINPDTPESTIPRYKAIDLIVPYNSYYHFITGLVEVNAQETKILEHPMLGLYHDGYLCKNSWKWINDLFNHRVGTYLNRMEDVVVI